MTSNNNLSALLLGAFLAYIFLSNFENNVSENVLYFQYCADEIKSETCKRYRYHSVDYKVFPQQQAVVIRAPLRQYKDCIVFDKNNWRCEKGSGDVVSVTNANYYETYGGKSSSDFQIASLFYYAFTAKQYLGFR